LWTHAAPPLEYIELVLCRDVFHVTRSALRAESASDILETLTMLDAEGEVAHLRAKSRKRK
jgi:hypothetical protein